MKQVWDTTWPMATGITSGNKTNVMNRLFKSGIVTTILGIGIVCVGVWLYVSPDHTEIEAGAVALLGMTFLRSKDSLIGIKGKDETP